MCNSTQQTDGLELRNYFAQEKLRNGDSVIIRAIQSADKANLQDLMRHLSPQSRYFRFFSPKEVLTELDLVKFTELDFSRHVGLIACILRHGHPVPVASARYIVSPVKDGPLFNAEVSFVVEEEFQGLGIATLLLKHLAKIARTNKIDEFVAYVLADNVKMLHVFANCGLEMSQSMGEQGVKEVKLTLSQLSKV